ncbi:4-coumarate--CoA ligase 1-like [Zerene cesonia]|uniref:4-coumarate--CoA ligase 1-like n=1 Tax=Zerene cesonia TaxID=33412 RepID=UPI0018E56677|nr:4-coumarate--CoA ligase 1-like [Zerene cesonia]
MEKVLRTLQRTLIKYNKSSKCSIMCVRQNSVWTNDGIIKSPFKDIQIPNCTVYDYVWQNLERWPERTMSVCAITGRGYTYEQAFKLSNAFAANLRKKLKIRNGDTVAIMLPNVPDYPLVALGILEAGGVITTINPIYTANEVHRLLLMSEARAIVTLPELVGVIKNAFKLANTEIPLVVVKTNGESTPEGTMAFNDLSEDVHVDKSCLKEVRRSPNDICFLPYSSGTTGLPKGVELTSKNITANCEQINEPKIQLYNETTATHQDSVMSVLPFFHIYAATVLMFHKMSHGIKLVTLPKMNPDHFMNALEKYKTNLVFVAPPLVQLMATHPAASPKTYRHLQMVINGAAPMASTDAERFLNKVQRKIRFNQGYGLTETSPVVCVAPIDSDDYSAVGPPVPSTQLKIVGGDMEPLGPNQTGELLVRGPQVMKGYRNNPEANSEAFADGWFLTGDMAVADENGVVKIVDRIKELIKVKGFQVPPAELEAVLRDHPSVKDAAVIGVPHPTKGESPRAFVVPKEGAKSDIKDISDFVNEKVASFKRIDDIMFVDCIPKSAAGKILKKELKAKYC